MSALDGPLNLSLPPSVYNDYMGRVKESLTQLIGAEVDDTLPEYVMVMVAGSNKSRPVVTSDLEAFLGAKNANDFTQWVWKELSPYSNGTASTSAQLSSVVVPLRSQGDQISIRIDDTSDSKGSRRHREGHGGGGLMLVKAARDAADSANKAARLPERSALRMDEELAVADWKGASVEEMEMQDKCSECGRFGHSARTCRGRKSRGRDVAHPYARPQRVVRVSTRDAPAQAPPSRRDRRARTDTADVSHMGAPITVTLNESGQSFIVPPVGYPSMAYMQQPAFPVKKDPSTVRCSYWPNCSKGDACPFVHPSQPCTRWPNCAFGAKCLYIHPEKPCRMGALCTRPNCAFTHPFGAVPHYRPTHHFAPPAVNFQKVYAPAQDKSRVPCRFAASCNRPDCPYAHNLVDTEAQMNVDVSHLSSTLPSTPPHNPLMITPASV
eukprot:GILK01004335.1.p1 GENE.GILK01004335.1~~GILK01004335.1.p1  ORF type:complete len:451 (+),score=24.45 GILK01004335.1:42-1355(+)